MIDNRAESICIVGGGSAGWITALAIIENIAEISVTLVEDPNTPSVGVGEATQPGVQRFFKKYLNLEEEDWMKSTDATYKVGGYFKNFNSLDLGDKVYHALVTGEEEDNSNVYSWGIKKLKHGLLNNEYSRDTYYAPKMSEGVKFDKRGKEEEAWYAVQFDATKFAELSKDICLAKGITYVPGKVVSVNVSDDLKIDHIKLDSGKGIKADFFIDCTGFRSLLIEGALSSKFIDMSEYLPNDYAIATKIPYTDKATEMEPITGAQALSAGWAWNIPLQSRIGAGYVYSSKFISKDRAETEFLEYLTNKYPVEKESLELTHIKMKVGYQETPWKSNCLAIGLSSLFIEPLESTGLTFITSSVERFIKYITVNNLQYSKLTQSRYNEASIRLFEEAYNFVIAHYLNTTRGDSEYWRFIRDELDTTTSLKEYLYKIDEGGGWEPSTTILFHKAAWEQILIGFNIVDVSSNVELEGLPISRNNIEEPRVRSLLASLQTYESNIEEEVQRMSSLYNYLKHKENLYGNDSDS
jgi:tryptophan halogenase